MPNHFSANWEKKVNFVLYSGSHSGCDPTGSKLFQIDLGSLDLSNRENVMEQVFGCLLVLWLWALPYCHSLRGNCHWKMNSKQMFSSSVWLSAHSTLGKLCSFNEGKASTESVFFIAGTVQLLRCESSGLIKGPKFQSQDSVSCCTFWDF